MSSISTQQLKTFKSPKTENLKKREKERLERDKIWPNIKIQNMLRI